MADQSLAKERQREILEKELANEQELLADAKRQLANEESIEIHQKNIEALRRELKNLQR